VQAQEMQNMVGAMNQAVHEALKALNARLDEQTDATRKALADQKLIIDTLSNDLRVVREKLDDNNVRVGTLTQEVDSLRELITAMQRAPAIDPGLAPDAPVDPAAAGAAPGPPPAPSPAGIGVSPDRAWNLAMGDYYSGDFDLAISGFTAYLTNFPKSERADDAQFHIGQSYYTSGKYDQAIEAYGATIRIYPDSDLLPDAYVKLGESYRALKQVDRARQAFQSVIKNYPTSAAATLAEQRLQELK
jgi:tol-pal system protein YbgF